MPRSRIHILIAAGFLSRLPRYTGYQKLTNTALNWINILWGALSGIIPHQTSSARTYKKRQSVCNINLAFAWSNVKFVQLVKRNFLIWYSIE
jgi:hypothetical protein